MARGLLALVICLCCFVTNALAFRSKGVPLEYVSAVSVFEKADMLCLEIRLAAQGNLESVQLTKNGSLFQVKDSVIQFYRKFMVHGFEIGIKPDKDGGDFYIHPIAPTNYEGYSIVIDNEGNASIEKILSPYIRKKGESVKREDYKPKRIYPNNDKLQLDSLRMIYNLGLVLGKMEIETDSSSDSLTVKAFGRVDKIALSSKHGKFSSISLYEIKHNERYALKISDEEVQLTVSR